MFECFHCEICEVECFQDLPFYDIDNIVDDFVLISCLVGNDFLPQPPNIGSEQLPMLWKVYCDVLPSMGGYINSNGHLNLTRFQTFLNAAAPVSQTSIQMHSFE